MTEHNKTILKNQDVNNFPKSDTDNTTKINNVNTHEDKTSNPENNYNIAPVPGSPLEKSTLITINTNNNHIE